MQEVHTVKRNPSMFKALLSSISDISLTLSLMNLFLTYAVWLKEIKVGKTFFNFIAKVFEINLVSSFL